MLAIKSEKAYIRRWGIITLLELFDSNLLNQRENDKAILLVSLELDQVFDLSDRILVMYEGEIVGEFLPKEVTKEKLGLYMSGAKKDIVNAIKEKNSE